MALSGEIWNLFHPPLNPEQANLPTMIPEWKMMIIACRKVFPPLLCWRMTKLYFSESEKNFQTKLACSVFSSIRIAYSIFPDLFLWIFQWDFNVDEVGSETHTNLTTFSLFVMFIGVDFKNLIIHLEVLCCELMLGCVVGGWGSWNLMKHDYGFCAAIASESLMNYLWRALVNCCCF